MMYRCISLPHIPPGNGAPTKTPTVCCENSITKVEFRPNYRRGIGGCPPPDQSQTTKMFGMEDSSRILFRGTVALGLKIRH